jgi:hypothetical protein
VEADPVIWTARLRTGRVVIFQASGSRAFRAAALIAAVVEGDLADSAVIASAAAADLGVIVLAVEASAAVVDLAASAGVGSEADAEE